MNKVSPIEGFAAPAFVTKARAEFDALRKAHPDLQYVDAVLADVIGVLRGKRMPVAEAAKLFECGMPIPHSIYLMDANGEMTNPLGRGYGDGDPDGTAWPIPGTMSRVWGEGAPRAQMLMTLRDANGVADPAEPRAALERVLERFAALKLKPVCALELEFYLIDPKRGHGGAPLPPLDPRSGAREKVASVYGIDDLDRYEAFLSALTAAAVVQNVPVSATSKEYSPGQFEANLRHQTDALRAADHAVFLKQIVKAAARSAGFEASFMAKPYVESAGTGLHIHMSLIDEQGRNVFDNGKPEGSDTIRHVIAGLQTLMPESMALFAPNVNSYRRFQPDTFAPVNRRWGVNNRSAGLRIPVGPGEARRIEHRVAGADANPYFALAAVLAGALHGLSAKRDPGPAAIGNVSREPDMALPFSIDDALNRLENAPALTAFLGEETLALYRETKRIEAQRLRRVITTPEYEWYL
ncbi:MAG TPA: glutamine synthetase family protein [Rhizomicrobium sp.]|nr:glutamine synthetase family protein [Rhizomicrobium sp.]